MQDFENAVAAPTPGGAGGKAALNAAAAAATVAPTPRRALGELKTNANALTPAAAAAVPLGAAHPQQQKVQMHAPLQRQPTGKPPVAPPQQQQKKATGVVTIQTAAPSPSPSLLLQLPPVERPAGMPLDQQLAAEELRAQALARGAAQAICGGVPLSLPPSTTAGRYSSSRRARLLGPAAAAAAARAFTVFGFDDDENEAECCRPSSAPSTPPAESSFLGEEDEQDFAPSPPSLDDALASLELCADRASEGEGEGGDVEKSSSKSSSSSSNGGGGERESGGGGGGASVWAVSPPRGETASGD